jgi:glycine/D-amino acid oxidase-like deaminating enzyme
VKTAIVIGAGVTGLSTAYHLAKRGYGRVIVLEKNEIGAGSSSRAAGISTGLLWSETGVRARRHALRIFREFSNELPGYTFHNEHGCLNLFSPELWPARAALLPLYDRLEAPYQLLKPAEIRRRWPGLNPAGDFLGLLDPTGGYSEPAEYLSGLTQRARALGVEIREKVQVDEICLKQGRACGVRTAEGVIPADVVIVATYAWMQPLLASIGLSLPIKTFVHQRYLSAPLESPVQFPPVNADPFWGYIRPARGNRILLGIETPDRDDFKVTSLDFRLERLTEATGLIPPTVERFRDFFPTLADLQWESTHIGLISFSMDGEPIIGPAPGVEGLWIGNCFHSGGFSYSPAAGFFLAELAATGSAPIDLTAFSPARFASVPAQTAGYLASTVPQRHASRRRH